MLDRHQHKVLAAFAKNLRIFMRFSHFQIRKIVSRGAAITKI